MSLENIKSHRVEILDMGGQAESAGDIGEGIEWRHDEALGARVNAAQAGNGGELGAGSFGGIIAIHQCEEERDSGAAGFVNDAFQELDLLEMSRVLGGVVELNLEVIHFQAISFGYWPKNEDARKDG